MQQAKENRESFNQGKTLSLLKSQAALQRKLEKLRTLNAKNPASNKIQSYKKEVQVQASILGTLVEQAESAGLLDSLARIIEKQGKGSNDYFGLYLGVLLQGIKL